MGQIITPGSGGSGLTTAISADVIAYYRFEETADLAVALDSAMNFNAVVPAMRAAGKIGNGLPCAKENVNFDANMLLDEIPSSYQVTVEMWLKLTEAIKKGEHGTFTIFSKQWATGMKWYCYLISRLESVSLRVCLSYSNTDASAGTVLFAGAMGGSFAANGIYSKVSAVKYIQALDSTWTIEWDGATKWEVIKYPETGPGVSHFGRVNATVAGAYDATLDGEGTTVTATALVARQDEYEIPCGELAAGAWHKLYLLLKLRDDYLSQFGIYLDDQYAGGNTAYQVDLPLNTDISPDLLGGDAANVKIATNDPTIPYLVDGYPFPSSHRYGLPAIVDEVIVSRILLKPITGAGGERPKLFLSSEGLGSAAAVPVETDYDLNESVVLTATPAGGTLDSWIVNGVDMGTTNPYTLIMTPGDKTVIAVFGGKVATPTASPAGADYSIAQSVVLSCITSGAAIYYTTNGSTPTSGSTLYTVPITIAAGMTLKAIGIKGGLTDSNVMSEVYTFTLPAPILNPDGGTYGSEQDVAMTDLMTGAAIYYTTDGSEPDTGDTLYTTAVHVADGTTLKAKAFKADCTTSATKTAVYTVAGWIRKTDFGGVERYDAYGFYLSGTGKVYVGGGYPSTFVDDLWEYDPSTNAWTLLLTESTSFKLWGASAVGIGTKGYRVCGQIVYPSGAPVEIRNIYVYNQPTNVMAGETLIPGVARHYAIAFALGTDLYCGGGTDGSTNLTDFYKYDTVTPAWTTKASLPFAGNWYSFVAGTKAYIIAKNYLGETKLYEYDPTGNAWVAKTDCPVTASLYRGVAFGVGLFGYFMRGGYGTNPNEFYQYNPATNAWVTLSFSGTVRQGAAGIATTAKGYVACGIVSSSASKEFWEFTS